MVEIEGKLISKDIFEKKFVCDLSACKGECCVAGDSGAPLTFEEIAILEDIYDEVKPYMTEEGIAAVDKQGVFYVDVDKEPVTTLINDHECAFVNYDKNGIAKCSIEDAHRDGKVNWKKPISCHLYPIRTKELSEYEAMNYHGWDVCKPACECGSKLDVKVYKFLKEPIIRKYGSEFFEQLEAADKLLEERNNS